MFKVEREARKYLIAQGYEQPGYIIFSCGDILESGHLEDQEGSGVVLYSLLWRLRDELTSFRFRSTSGRFACWWCWHLSSVCRRFRKIIVKLAAVPDRAGERRSGHMCFRHFRVLEPTVIFVVSVRPCVCVTASSNGRFFFFPLPPSTVKIYILDFTKICSCEVRTEAEETVERRASITIDCEYRASNFYVMSFLSDIVFKSLCLRCLDIDRL
jgi:hypothetical protein